MPRVTVLLPVYNGERHLGEAIESILGQTFTDFELLVVDDGSTDRSTEILATVGDARVRVVRNARNLGLTKSLNLGLALARGSLIARQDADDVSEPERLARQVDYLDAHPDVALVGSWYRKIGEDGAVLGDRSLPVEPAQLAWALLFYCPIVHSAAVFRREAIAAMGGYDERFAYAQDYDLWSRLARRHRLANQPELLVRYRVGATTMTATIADDSGEVPRIAIANVAAALSAVAGGASRAPTAEEHRAMYDTLYARDSALGSSALVGAFARILAVLDAFCAQPIVAPASSAALRADVRATLRRRLVEWLGRFDDDGFARARALVAPDVRWLRLLRTRPARATYGALRRSGFARVLPRGWQ